MGAAHLNVTSSSMGMRMCMRIVKGRGKRMLMCMGVGMRMATVIGMGMGVCVGTGSAVGMWACPWALFPGAGARAFAPTGLGMGSDMSTLWA